jgi:hypothetical protein
VTERRWCACSVRGSLGMERWRVDASRVESYRADVDRLGDGPPFVRVEMVMANGHAPVAIMTPDEFNELVYALDDAMTWAVPITAVRDELARRKA